MNHARIHQQTTMKLKFIEQKYQTDCVINIIKAFEGLNFENIEQLDISKQKLKEKNQIDILMETGTGKTFTYIETVFRLHEVYGLKKFIIFVPSLAIKEGTLKNFEVTKEYFYNKYKRYVNLISYDGKTSISSIKHL